MMNYKNERERKRVKLHWTMSKHNQWWHTIVMKQIKKPPKKNLKRLVRVCLALPDKMIRFRPPIMSFNKNTAIKIPKIAQPCHDISFSLSHSSAPEELVHFQV